MRDVYKEYKQGLISWDRAYCTANNEAALKINSLILLHREETLRSREKMSMNN